MTGEIRPRLRPIQASRSEQYGQSVVVLSDPLGLSEHHVALPISIAPLLELCDGTRDIPTLGLALELRTGIRMGPEYLDRVISVLDEALLLDSERFEQAYRDALETYRSSGSRLPAMIGTINEETSENLGRMLEKYFDALPSDKEKKPEVETVRGLISPHIDFQRGGPTYAGVWQRAMDAVQGAEVAVILGTNHLNGQKLVTLTRQSYSTPWGVLPTAIDVVDAVASELGENEVFVDELNHRKEHSVEAAAIWLHYLTGERKCELVPVLCGSFQRFIEGDERPCEDGEISRFVDVMREAIADRRTLIVAAGDLAHIGPAFGDPFPMGVMERANLSTLDNELMAVIARGDAEGFFRMVKQEGDRTKVCGLSPIYLALRLLGETRGEITGYDQCPADHQGTSFVSICGMVFS